MGFPKTLGSTNRRTTSHVTAAVSACTDLERRVCATGSADGIFERRQSKTQAEQALTQWLGRIKALGLDCFAPFITTLDNWRDKITNYFIGRETSGFIEGLNNKIKVIKRRCYGIYNLGRLFQHIWLDVQGRQILFAKH
ncbi:transposase [Methylotuvimicrobium alcaliphilum]|uniref:transposase n=1 Tax=Methylotuvimicrobium alcaliphilum TaxID=271065 RepID=UPI00139247A4|nr:transposase [Methylotuvimicrobium alcaliphilum]